MSRRKLIARLDPRDARPDGVDDSREVMAEAAGQPDSIFISPRQIFQSIGLTDAALT